MKGQYLAIETMMTFTMGIALAIGTIAMFSDYRSDVMSTTTDKQVQVVESELRNAVFHLKSSDSGNMKVELPSEISGSDYSVALHDSIRVSVNQRSFEHGLDGLNQDYNFEGSVEGGTVELYKTGDRFVLREG